MPLTLGLSLGITNQLGGSGGTVLPTFTYQTETETLASAFSVAPTRRRKRTMDWAIKTLKDAGVWTKLKGFYQVGNDQQSSLINWKTPGTNNLTIVGTPTFTANTSFAPAANSRLMTGILLNSLDPANCGIFVYAATVGTPTGIYEGGATDASGNGIGISTKISGSLVITGRCGAGALGAIATAADTDGFTFHCISRRDNANVQGFRGPVKKGTISNASAASMGATEICFLANNVNGTFSVSGKALACFGVLQAGLTDAEAKVLANVVETVVTDFRYGEFDTYDAGVQPQTVAGADVVIFGATSQGAVHAYEAKRQGLNPIIVGGYRERHVGGMSAGGLGQTDFDNKAGLGGLPRWIMAQMQAIQGTASTNFKFEPRYFSRIVAQLLDPRNANGLDVPVYWSDGLLSVQKTGTRITSITTVDGRTFSGDYFVDATYEGDLMKAAGISTRLGREAIAEFSESLNGYRGILDTFGSDNHQYKTRAGALMNVDPYVTPGVPASGLLPNVRAAYVSGTPALGDADNHIQAYNFRITTTTNPAYRVPFPSTPPAGYNVANYEALLRRLAADPTILMADMFLYDTINTAGDIFDLNAKGGFSTDPYGLSWGYPAADYATRETLWKAHANHIYGLFYLLQYDPDPRVPAALRTEALSHGLQARHYTRPRLDKGDDFQWMPQLYVREAYRLDNDFMLRQSDISHTDGTTPRSIKTISTISYAMDSHSNQALADPNGGTPRIWNEGNWEADRGGVDLITPVPYEVLTPRKTECENLLVPFAAAATHVAFGAWRMEFTSMQAAQSAAHAIKVAKTAGNQAVQDVDYPTVRTSILASNTLSGETQPVLPQVN